MTSIVSTDAIDAASATTVDAKQLSADINASALRLSVLLKEEDHWKDTRTRALRLLQAEEELPEGEESPFESALTASLTTLQDEASAMEEGVSALSRSHADLTAKVAKTKKALIRAQEQEAELETLRPAWQDEYEMLEDDLQELHQAYVSRVRNMHYLQKELKKIDRCEARTAKRAEDKRMELLRNILAEEAEAEEEDEEDEEDEEEEEEELQGDNDGDSSTTGASTAGRRPGTAVTARLSIARSDSSSSISSVAGARSLSSNNSNADTTDSDSAW